MDGSANLISCQLIAYMSLLLGFKPLKDQGFYFLCLLYNRWCRSLHKAGDYKCLSVVSPCPPFNHFAQFPTIPRFVSQQVAPCTRLPWYGIVGWKWLLIQGHFQPCCTFVGLFEILAMEFNGRATQSGTLLEGDIKFCHVSHSDLGRLLVIAVSLMNTQ